MRTRFLAVGLIFVVLLGFIQNSSVAATKYEYNTYRAGYKYTLDLMKFWQISEYVYSASTGRVIYKQALKFCSKLNKDNGGYLLSKNAQKGCADAIRDRG